MQPYEEWVRVLVACGAPGPCGKEVSTVLSGGKAFISPHLASCESLCIVQEHTDAATGDKLETFGQGEMGDACGGVAVLFEVNSAENMKLLHRRSQGWADSVLNEYTTSEQQVTSQQGDEPDAEWDPDGWRKRWAELGKEQQEREEERRRQKQAALQQPSAEERGEEPGKDPSLLDKEGGTAGHTANVSAVEDKPLASQERGEAEEPPTQQKDVAQENAATGTSVKEAPVAMPEVAASSTMVAMPEVAASSTMRQATRTSTPSSGTFPSHGHIHNTE